ncbi:MAG TPA: arginine--tRNA ligase [Candidatus Absconditabacterales bacterium]|nr:arginine--tRNA ligase [Candidatus Absconditabacterales bacterium]
MLNSYKKQFAELLQKTELNISIEDILNNIEIVPNNIKGDLGFPCFKLSKEFKKSPNQIAQDFVSQIDNEKVIAVGPYVNYLLSSQDLSQDLIKQINADKNNFGKLDKKNQEIILEGRQPNTHKAFHIGHLRNALVSETVSSCLRRAGYDVNALAYIGDIGAHVAKWIWYYQSFYQGETPEQNFGERAGQLYSDATKKVDEDPESYKPQIEKLQKDLEDGDKKLNEIRKETRQKCLIDFQNIFEELGCNIQKRYYESDVEKLGIQKVKQMYEDGIAIDGERGSVIMDLEEYKLGIFLLLKSTGASLYSTKDIGLAYLKKQDFPNYNKSVYVVGSEQEYHFRQLFKTLELMGFPHDKLQHVSYGLVDLKDGKMSSRDGNVVLYTELRDKLLQEANKMIKDRNLLGDKKEKIAKQVAFGALKFDMLLPDTSKKILFDANEALSFEGETGPYIQYTHARCASLIKKGNLDLSNIDFADFNEDYEKNILIHLAQFSDYISKSAEEYKPNYVARYLLDLSKLFNSYYNNTDKKIIENNSGLALVACVKQVLSNGLSILGIDSPDEM